VVIQIYAGDRALPHADGGGPVAGDEAAEELKKDGVVAHSQQTFAVREFREHGLEGGEGCIRQQGGTYFDFGVVAELGADKLRGLQGALEGAGDDDIDLHLEGAQHARHQHALVLAFLDEAPLGVECGVLAEDSGIGVAHEVEDHSEMSGGGTRAVGERNPEK